MLDFKSFIIITADFASWIDTSTDVAARRCYGLLNSSEASSCPQCSAFRAVTLRPLCVRLCCKQASHKAKSAGLRLCELVFHQQKKNKNPV